MTHRPVAHTVRTQSGEVRGASDRGSRRWLGIPYAGPTGGDARWQPPQPVSAWQGIRDCTQFGDIAEQPETPLFPKLDAVTPSENCLSLNIWAPETVDSPAGLPVAVWIHGGGFIIGASAQPTYDGSALARQGNLVVVTINYRLGVFGFLDFTALVGSSDRFFSNVGLRDIVAALTWVRENIAGFGGDPNRVTVLGQSAGAAAITTLMTMPTAQGLFHQAIAQSPPATSVYGTDRNRASAEVYLNLIGVSAGDAAKVLPGKTAAELVPPTTELLNSIARSSPGTLAFAPTVDGEFVPDYPAAVFERGEQHPIPLLIGSTKNEAGLFTMLKSPLMPTDAASIEEMFSLLQAEEPSVSHLRERVLQAYPQFPRKPGALQVSSDAGIGMPVQWLAAAHARAHPTFVYRFDQATPLMKLMRLGAVHASELPYTFGTVPERNHLNRRQAIWWGGLRAAQRVSASMQESWIQFISDGSPGWQAFTPDRRATKIINAADTVQFDPARERRTAWGDRVLQFR